MSGDKGEHIFEVWHALKHVIELANKYQIGDVELSLRIAGDTLVHKYHALGLPTQKDVHSLVWETEEWPAKTATFLELKSMLLKAQEVESARALETTDRDPAGTKRAADARR